jgi:hypothetical protein
MPENISEIPIEARNFVAPETEAKQPDFVIDINPDAAGSLDQQKVIIDGTRINFPNSSNYFGAGIREFGGPHYKGMKLRPVADSQNVTLEHFYKEPSRPNVPSQNYIISNGALTHDFTKPV